jgi:hypothetical protein
VQVNNFAGICQRKYEYNLQLVGRELSCGRAQPRIVRLGQPTQTQKKPEWKDPC